MKNVIKLLSASILFIAVYAHADLSDPYFAVGVGQAGIDIDGAGDAKPLAVYGTFGGMLSPNFAVEGRLGMGLADDSISGADVEIDSFYGVYAKGIIPSDSVSFYGLIGYTYGKITVSGGGLSASESDGDVSFGAGIDIPSGKNSAFNVEWAQLFEGDDYEVNGLFVGYRWKF